MSSPSQADVVALVKPTLGAILLGMAFSSAFFGITLLQTYQYYDRYWNDGLGLKLFVVIIGILDTAQLVAVVQSNWWYLIENYGNVSALTSVEWSLGVEIAMTCSVGLLVQMFFAKRVWALSEKNTVITTLIILTTLTQFSLGIYYTTLGQSTDFSSIAKITWASTASLACSIAGDVIITASMCFYLHRSRSGMRRTDKLINVLIVYTVNTGLLTTICAICTIILVSILPFATFTGELIYCKCYVNSTLASLNARSRLRSLDRAFLSCIQFVTVDKTQGSDIEETSMA
ncbi:hypothetical protein A0H81_05649 [Grifola frondosa]|uniref:DUF6534 domain-containing protein n=1 Tax=Grifola frondosa TaxID=5627 RepID=A0A1C7MEU8_GRIFR|nr:hypothetical protein A0H81_05649 [Grifola frondosa]